MANLGSINKILQQMVSRNRNRLLLPSDYNFNTNFT